MDKRESNNLLIGLIAGGFLGLGFVIFLSSKFISKTNQNLRERRHKFFEGIDDIFDESGNYSKSANNLIDKDTEEEIIDELFSRTN